MVRTIRGLQLPSILGTAGGSLGFRLDPIVLVELSRRRSGSTLRRSGRITLFPWAAVMKCFRFSISSLMAVVLLVALDCMAINIFLSRPLFPASLSELIFFGALPMANLLAIGLFRLWKERNGRVRTRPNLVGFEVFGGIALLLFFVCIWVAPDSLHDRVGVFLRSLSLRPGDPLLFAGAVVILLLPQLALASVGGWLVSRYRIEVKIVVERRTAGLESPLPGLTEEPARITSVSHPPFAGPT